LSGYANLEPEAEELLTDAKQRFHWGFIGAPIAVVITHNLLAICLALYVYFIDGSQCWPGFSRQALWNWAPMVKLGFSGFLMVIAEFLAFEILTLASSYLSNTILAAQAALASLSIVTFQIPFPISIAGSTRLANLIGAGLPGASKKCIQVTLMMAFAAGLLNMILLTTLRDYIPKLFTEDMEVRAVIVAVLPIFAGFQLFDAGVASVNGIMRGMGLQGLGSWVNMCCYYLVGVFSFSPDNFFPG
jgi:MATE family multidrug resistance protein